MTKYNCDVDDSITPQYYSNGIPVFHPTMEQFVDFYRFNKLINKYGMQSGIVKVIPPSEWSAQLDGIYTEENLEGVKIKNPIVQQINSSGNGVFTTQNVERPRLYNLFQWKELLEKPNYQPPAPRRRTEATVVTTTGIANLSCTLKQSEPVKPSVISDDGLPKKDLNHQSIHTNQVFETINHHTKHAKQQLAQDTYSVDRCKELEHTYWKTLTYAEPMYGADMLGLLFPSKISSWNVLSLPNILDMMDTKLPGVNDAYLYAGLWKATFAWHLEDQDLYSINYLHFGAPKQWYLISQAESGKFFDLMKDTFPEDFKNCSEFLRHKTFSVSPQFLEKNGVAYNKILHNEGEFIITYPYGYHAGFNYGFNLAESVNFALDDWFPIGEVTKKCECVNDSVGINVKQLYCKYAGEEYHVNMEVNVEVPYEEESEGPNKRRRMMSIKPKKIVKTAQVTTPPILPKKLQPSQLVRPKIPASKKPLPCCLCPNSIAVNSPLFQLLETDMKVRSVPLKAHRLCASVFPQLRLEGSKYVGLRQISKVQRKLKCMVCAKGPKKPTDSDPQDIGACFQCTYPKCTRSYHATCALGDGIEFNFPNEEFLCKFHRKTPTQKADLEQSNLGSEIRNTFLDLVKVPTGGWVQFQVRGLHYTGLVELNNSDEHTFTVKVYPELQESFEAAYACVLVGTPYCVIELPEVSEGRQDEPIGRQDKAKNDHQDANIDSYDQAYRTGYANQTQLTIRPQGQNGTDATQPIHEDLLNLDLYKPRKHSIDFITTPVYYNQVLMSSQGQIRP